MSDFSCCCCCFSSSPTPSFFSHSILRFIHSISQSSIRCIPLFWHPFKRSFIHSASRTVCLAVSQLTGWLLLCLSVYSGLTERLSVCLSVCRWVSLFVDFKLAYIYSLFPFSLHFKRFHKNKNWKLFVVLVWLYHSDDYDDSLGSFLGFVSICLATKRHRMCFWNWILAYLLYFFVCLLVWLSRLFGCTLLSLMVIAHN